MDVATGNIKSTMAFGRDKGSCMPRLSQSQEFVAVHTGQATLTVIDSESLQEIWHADLRDLCETEQQRR